LRLAAQLAGRGTTTVFALGVAPPLPLGVSSLISPQPVSVDEESRRMVLVNLRRVLHALPGADRWVTRAVIGTPADAINDAATKWKASIIVMGLGRHNRVDRILGRETAVSVIRRAHLPVLAVPAAARALPTRGVAAVDFTPASLAAAKLAGDLIGHDGTLFVAHACAFCGAKSRPGDLVDLYRAGARAKLEDAVRELRRRVSCRVEGVMLEGEPGETLIKFARRERCGLIALGGHEQGLVDRILIGSVRTRVVRDARCSVLIAPPRSGP
jgi:nucleotide-binding universal stress UspA family protein